MEEYLHNRKQGGCRKNWSVSLNGRIHDKKQRGYCESKEVVGRIGRYLWMEEYMIKSKEVILEARRLLWDVVYSGTGAMTRRKRKWKVPRIRTGIVVIDSPICQRLSAKGGGGNWGSTLKTSLPFWPQCSRYFKGLLIGPPWWREAPASRLIVLQYRRTHSPCGRFWTVEPHLTSLEQK